MSRMIHTLCFSAPVTFKDQTGARFYNETTKQYAEKAYCASELPAKLIAYEVYWTVDPQKGESIDWIYDGKGTYESSKHIYMKAQSLEMINCLNLDQSEKELVQNFALHNVFVPG